MASQPEAGCALLAFKHALLPLAAVVPALNSAALRFLPEHGAEQTARAVRIALGDELDWKPAWIFARAAGYCG